MLFWPILGILLVTLIIFFLSAVDLNISGTKAVKMISAIITVYGKIFLRLAFVVILAVLKGYIFVCVQSISVGC